MTKEIKTFENKYQELFNRLKREVKRMEGENGDSENIYGDLDFNALWERAEKILRSATVLRKGKGELLSVYRKLYYYHMLIELRAFISDKIVELNRVNSRPTSTLKVPPPEELIGEFIDKTMTSPSKMDSSAPNYFERDVYRRALRNLRRFVRYNFRRPRQLLSRRKIYEELYDYVPKRGKRNNVIKNEPTGDVSAFTRYVREAAFCELRLSRKIRDYILKGAEISSLTILPPAVPSLNVTANVSLSVPPSVASAVQRAPNSPLHTPSEPSFNLGPDPVEGKLYLGVDLNQLAGPRPLAFGIIEDRSNGGEKVRALKKDGTIDLDSAPEPMAIKRTFSFDPAALIADIGVLTGILPPADHSNRRPLSENDPRLPWARFWTRVREAVLLPMRRPGEENPFWEDKPLRGSPNSYEGVHLVGASYEEIFTKDLDSYSFNDLLMAPARYWAVKRIHLAWHISRLQRKLAEAKKKLKDLSSQGTQGKKAQRDAYLAARMVSVYKREIRALHHRVDSLRSSIYSYLARVLHYVIKGMSVKYPGKLASIAYEENVGKSEGLSGYMAKVVGPMVKNVRELLFTSEKNTNIQPAYATVEELFNADPASSFEGIKEIVHEVRASNTSARYFEALTHYAMSYNLIDRAEALARNEKVDVDTLREGFKRKHTALMDGWKKWLEAHEDEFDVNGGAYGSMLEGDWLPRKNVREEFKRFLREYMLRVKGVVFDLELCIVYRSGSADWGFSPVILLMRLRKVSAYETIPFVFESHDSAACTIALRSLTERRGKGPPKFSSFTAAALFVP